MDSTELLSLVNRVDKVQVYNHYLHYSVFCLRYKTKQQPCLQNLYTQDGNEFEVYSSKDYTQISEISLEVQGGLDYFRVVEGTRITACVRLNYDQVACLFLQDTLIYFIFPPTLMSCISSTFVSLLWDGSKIEQFIPFRGIEDLPSLMCG
ncbi:hypothetical protein MTR_1g023470 [Medicago truncatula]|uniref:Uncharacterized protein n=1 Tax=Medicago truncatula TaxID=3880 RepID=G7I5Y2_MEDTR|nr:hypothetical protein MTR_1g023470 [Medicago truncatula]